MVRGIIAVLLILLCAPAFAEDVFAQEKPAEVSEASAAAGNGTVEKSPGENGQPESAPDGDAPREIRMSQADAMGVAAKMIEAGGLKDAKMLLSHLSFADNAELETERRFLLGQIALKEGDYDDAIEIFREILDDDPSLSRVRLDLALAYLQTRSFYKADYHFRLAMSEPMPPEVQANVYRMLYYIRQNKNWNLWLNLGIAPDNNINNANSDAHYVYTPFGWLQYQNPEKKRDVGFSVGFGGNYEFKLSDEWRIKNDFALSLSDYSEDGYDDLFASASSGPRYVFERGDIWLAATGNRRWLGHTPYSTALGAKLETSYDLTRQLSSRLALRWLPMRYDEFDMLDGKTYGATLSFSYTLSSSEYITMRTGYDREATKEDTYGNRRHSYAVGFGAELPWGFSIHLEPSVTYTSYDHEQLRLVDYGTGIDYIRPKDTTWRYSVYLLNRKISYYGFTPTFGYSYTDRKSNTWQSEFKKSSFEFGITQRF
jgi:hypothetical protein